MNLIDNEWFRTHAAKSRYSSSYYTILHPGKIAYDVSSDRLFISDSNNHRIVITTGDGAFVNQIGGEWLGIS